MKTKFTLLFCGFALVGFAQNATTSPMVWLQPELINPAASGLQHTFEASTSAYQNLAFPFEKPWGGNMSVNGKLDKISSGFGISLQTNNVKGLFDVEVQESNLEAVFQTLRINYNYQFSLKNDAILALGVAFQNDVARYNLASNTPIMPQPDWEPRVAANKLNFGAAYQGDNLYVGVALQNAVDFSSSNPNLDDYLNLNTYSLHASYDFTAGSRVKITPGFLYRLTTYPAQESPDNTSRDINFYVNATFADKLNLGLGFVNGEYEPDFALGTLGYTFAKKLQIQYGMRYFISDLMNTENPFFSQIALKYMLD